MRIPGRQFLFLTVFLWSAGSALAATEPLDGFDAYLHEAIEDWGAVGLAIAVVKDDQVAFAKGYGRRDLEAGGAVDTETLFHIGSTTKAFVAMALGMLVDDGKIAWDDPVIKHLPEFRVADPYVTREITIRDILSHRTGVQTADLLWVRGYPRQVSFRHLRFAEQASSLRSKWEYNNLMFLVAGEVIAAVTARPFEDFIRARIFDPLGMSRSVLRQAEFAALTNTASAHDKIDGQMQVIDYPHIYEAGGAGLINSSLSDMAKWLRFLLREGALDGEPLVEPATLDAMLGAQMALQGPEYPAAGLADSHLFSYGLAWFLQDYRGQRMAMHTGSIFGMTAIVGLLPELDLGVVVLINTDHIELRHALMYDVFDRYLGARDKDWSQELLKLYRDLEEKQEEIRAERLAAREAGTEPSLGLEGYVGRYLHPLFGDLEIRLEDDRLVAVMAPKIVVDLDHWHHDTFRGKIRDVRLGEAMVSFTLGGNHQVEQSVVFGAIFKKEPSP